MSWSNDFIDLTRAENAGGAAIKLGTMTGPTECRIGNLVLTSADLLFSDRLLKPTCTKVSETAPDGGGKCTDESTYITALNAGDTVALYQLSDTKFLVLGRMVSV